jgi:hypothetical protein
MRMATSGPLTSEQLRRIAGALLFYAGVSSITDGRLVLKVMALLVGFGLWALPAVLSAARAERIRSSAR